MRAKQDKRTATESKMTKFANDNMEKEEEELLVLIEPRGNKLLLDNKHKQNDLIDVKNGLGPMFIALGAEEKLNERMLSYLNLKDLLIMANTSRALCTLVNADVSLWREIALSSNALKDALLEERLIRFSQWGHWKAVVLGRRYIPRKYGRLFSDTLHRPLQCAKATIDPYWLNRDNVRRESAKISVQEFIEKYETTRTPVVLKGFEQDFAKGIRRWENGLKEGVATLTSEGKFRCGGRSISSEAFGCYTDSKLAANDESPMYVFDSRFAINFPELGIDYDVPDIFKGDGRDLFEHMGAKLRPDYRWIIAGAAKSGSK
jgi:hypothetical protein